MNYICPLHLGRTENIVGAKKKSDFYNKMFEGNMLGPLPPTSLTLTIKFAEFLSYNDIELDHYHYYHQTLYWVYSIYDH